MHTQTYKNKTERMSKTLQTVNKNVSGPSQYLWGAVKLLSVMLTGITEVTSVSQ